MTSISLPRKVFQGVAKRADMFRMFGRYAKRPDRFGGNQSAPYAGEWFEIDEISYSYMLDILPPLWMRGPICAMREFLTGSITSVFYAIRIDDAVRYFHKLECFCFTRQTLAPGEHRRMPVVFVLDPAMPKDMPTVSLSYTFFAVEGAN